VAGVVESIKLVPRPDTMRLEIAISDGTGEISGVWFRRHKIEGLDLGERVVFEGMIGSPAPGKLEILHPTYQLLGRPGGGR
jgi:RecG-like helicase